MKSLIGVAVVKSALHGGNILAVFVFGMLLGFVVCWLLYVVLHKIFFGGLSEIKRFNIL